MSDRSSLTRRSLLAGSAAAGAAALLHRPGRAAAGDAEITLKLATVAPPGTPWAKHVKRIKRRIDEDTGGRVVIKARLGGSLGDEISTLQRCQQGSIHLWLGSIEAFEKFAPELCAFALPYLFPAAKSADAVIDEHVATEVDSILDKAGFKLLFATDWGVDAIGTNFGVVKSPTDLKGKRLRTPQSFAASQTLGHMGATAEQIPATDVMTALASGVVDGVGASPMFTLAASWHEALTHISLTRHRYLPALAVVNKTAWNDMPSELQTAVAGDRLVEAKWGRRKVRAMQDEVLDALKAAGIYIHQSSASERAAFEKATAPVHEKWTSKYGTTLYDAIKEAL